MNFSKKKNKKDKRNLNFINKTIVKKLVLLPLLLSLFLFIGCQEEFNEITLGTDEEILVADSYVVSLMKNTVTKDGSSDNIIDNASCFTIQLPVNVIVNDLEIIVDSEEDFDVIEKIFDKYYDDDDYLEYVYPIVITLSDYTDVTIENKAQLEQYKAECKEDDDDIECVDFKYPLSYSVFNRKENTVKTIVINSDKEMYRFIKKISSTDIVSINFPITLIYTDGVEVEITDMSGLERAIEAGAIFCDEGDNNGYGSDDFTKEKLDNLLVKCPWVVHDVKRNNNSLTNTYFEYLMIFNENGVVKVRARNGDIITGTWITRVSDKGAMIKLEFDSFVDFTLEWFVHDIDQGRIQLITENENRIILQKKCDIIFDHTKERIKDFLQECHWRIARLSINDVDNESKYIGTPLKFFENGVVKLRVHDELVEGSWEITSPTTFSHILTMTFEGRPNLNLHWKIDFLSNEIIKLTNQNSKLILKRACNINDVGIDYVNVVLNTGKWIIALYETQEGNKTETFNNYMIEFLENGGIYVEINNEIINGSWFTYRIDDKLKLGLNFGLEPPFKQLNYRWKVLEINDERIKLVDFADDGSIERTLILEKK